jgi:hypothetical protein
VITAAAEVDNGPFVVGALGDHLVAGNALLLALMALLSVFGGDNGEEAQKGEQESREEFHVGVELLGKI